MDGAPHLVTQMTTRIGPVGLDTGLPEDRDGNVAVGRAGEPAIERPQDDAQPPPARFGRKVAGQQSPGGAEIVQACKRLQAGLSLAPLKEGVRQQLDRLEKAGARCDELKGPRAVAKQKMLQAIRGLQQHGLAGRAEQSEWRRVLAGRARDGREDLRTVARMPEDGCVSGVPVGRIAEISIPTVPGRRRIPAGPAA